MIDRLQTCKNNGLVVARQLHAACLLMACALFVSCGPAPSVIDAQRNFSEGARIELAQGRGENLGADIGGFATADPFAFYANAERDLSVLVQEDRDALEKDGLYGSAMVLRGLALWRLASLDGDTDSDYDKDFREQLQTIEAERSNWQLGTRDRVLSLALEGFHDLELARGRDEYGGSRGAEETIRSALGHFSTAVARSTDVPVDHPVRLYMTAVTLRALELWHVKIAEARSTCNGDDACSNRALDEDRFGVERDGSRIRGISDFAYIALCISNDILPMNGEPPAAIKQSLGEIGFPTHFRERDKWCSA